VGGVVGWHQHDVGDAVVGGGDLRAQFGECLNSSRFGMGVKQERGILV
jgi:hypothetical protein